MRHLAWLDATPEPLKNEKPQTRREILRQRKSPLLELPELEYPNLFEWFMEVGPCEFTQSGISPISYQEIKAWSDVKGLVLVENEGQVLKQLSAEYCTVYINGRDRDMPPPFIAYNFDPVKQSERIGNIFRQHKKYRKA